MPPLTGLAGGVILAQDGDEVALLSLELHTVGLLGSEVEAETAELQLSGINRLLSLEGLLLHTSLLLLDVGRDALDHLGHEVGEAEGGEEEEEEGLSASLGRLGRSAAGAARSTLEEGEI